MAEVRNIGVEITLSKAEQRIAKHIAECRRNNNRNHNVRNNRIGPQSDYDTDLEGVAAEMACSKLFNVYPDFSIESRSGGHDLELLGIRVDVKATRYLTGHLLAVIEKQEGDADVYVLMIGRFPTYCFAGCAKASQLLRPERITTKHGHGETYSMPQSDLSSSYCFLHGPFNGQCQDCEKDGQPALQFTERKLK